MSGAAEVHPSATLTPSKIELLQRWLPSQPWFAGDAADLRQAARFRFVDPDGEVGLDSIIATSNGVTYYVPLTWRAEPLDGASLVGTLEHSELGTRYGYDGQSDPVFLDELERVIREADTHSEIHDTHGKALPLTVAIKGSGVASDDEGDRLDIVRVLDRAADAPGDAVGTLLADWVDEQGPRHDVLAVLR